MFSLRKPSHTDLKDFLWKQQDLPFTYAEVGATRTEIPAGYTRGRQRVQLGTGRACYLDAKRCLAEWKMFPRGFVELVWPCPLETGRVVATLFQAPGFWTLNPCRIVYTFDEPVEAEGRAMDRFGFAYGTVGSHLACGEEKFSVEYHHDDESVWYEVDCFSKADHWLSKVAYPYLRLQQHRFRRLSALAMQQSVQEVERQSAAVAV